MYATNRLAPVKLCVEIRSEFLSSQVYTVSRVFTSFSGGASFSLGRVFLVGRECHDCDGYRIRYLTYGGIATRMDDPSRLPGACLISNYSSRGELLFIGPSGAWNYADLAEPPRNSPASPYLPACYPGILGLVRKE